MKCTFYGDRMVTGRVLWELKGSLFYIYTGKECKTLKINGFLRCFGGGWNGAAIFTDVC